MLKPTRAIVGLAQAQGRAAVLVCDLAAQTSLQLKQLGAASEGAVQRVISGCAHSELMDPSPHLLSHEVVITTGIALQFRDPRTWDAFVERLARVQVSALVFSVTPVHHVVPPGLVVACEAHDIPLFELPPSTTTLELARSIWQEISTEQHSIVRSGWTLADDCARIATTEGSTLQSVLQRVADEVAATVTLLDPKGLPLISASAAGSGKSDTSRTTLTVPGGTSEHFMLRVEGAGSSRLLQPLLGPVAALIAMQLSYTLASRSPLHSHTAARFIESLLDTNATEHDKLRLLARGAGFDPAGSWHTVSLRTAPSASQASLRLMSWRLRVQLEVAYEHVRFYEELHATTLVLQGPKRANDLGALLQPLVDATSGVTARHANARNLTELTTLLHIARRQSLEPGCAPIPRLDLLAITAQLPSAGLTALATGLLEPLQQDASGALTQTLRAYVEHSGSSKAVCEELFIHRNTLTYRLRRIEQLLGIDLNSGETRATCLIALRVLEES